MGLLLQTAIEKSTVNPRGPRCAISRVIDDLRTRDTDILDDFLVALTHEDVNARALAEAMFAINASPLLEGIGRGRFENSLRRHRRGDCVCATREEVQS